MNFEVTLTWASCLCMAKVSANKNIRYVTSSLISWDLSKPNLSFHYILCFSKLSKQLNCEISIHTRQDSVQLSQMLNVDMGNTHNGKITKHGFSYSGLRTQVYFVCIDLIFFFQVSVLSSVKDVYAQLCLCSTRYLHWKLTDRKISLHCVIITGHETVGLHSSLWW